jgi:hypothetical protein
LLKQFHSVVESLYALLQELLYPLLKEFNSVVESLYALLKEFHSLFQFVVLGIISSTCSSLMATTDWPKITHETSLAKKANTKNTFHKN